MGMWGWELSDDWTRFILMLVIPALAMAIWGIFAVPDDPSRSGNAPIKVSGRVRLALELVFFSFAAWAFQDTGFKTIGGIFGIVVFLHYLVSYDRIAWLLAR